VDTTLSIIKALREGSPLLYLIIFWGGFIMSLGACSMLRLPVIFGYVGGTTASKRETILVTLSFILGLILTYCILGLLFGSFAHILNYFFNWQTYVYYLLSLITVLVGLHLIGLIKIKIKAPEKILSSIEGKVSVWGIGGAFILGVLFVFLEGIISPCCGPILYVIATYTLFKGKILYGISIFFTYALGQAIPLLLISGVAGLIRTFQKLQYYWEYVEISCGLILLLLGLYFFAVA
jgi:cytochrome c biogenesis protein CcdA